MSSQQTQSPADDGFRIPDAQLASCGDVSCELLIDPIPRPTPDAIAARYRPDRREVLLLNTDKPNSLTVMTSVQRMLRERGIAVREEIAIKRDSTQPLDPARVEALAGETCLLVAGVNDCGSCSWGGLVDTLALQRRGVAAACVVTRPFAGQLPRVSAYQPVDRPLPCIVIDHPLQMISAADMDARARQIVSGIEALLDDRHPESG